MWVRRSVPALGEGFICEGTADEKIGDPGTSRSMVCVCGQQVKSNYSGIASLRSSYVQGTALGTLWIQGQTEYLWSAIGGIHIIHMDTFPNNGLSS